MMKAQEDSKDSHLESYYPVVPSLEGLVIPFLDIIVLQLHL